jgi:hypothetical protein
MHSIPEQQVVSQSDPRHNALEMINYKPQGNKPFIFTNTNHTKNQEMVQDKLCQYLTIYFPSTPLEDISSIQNGICKALSLFFTNEQNLDNFKLFLNELSRWNGEEKTITPFLHQNISELISLIKTVYWKPNTQKSEYVDSNLFWDLLREYFSEHESQMQLLRDLSASLCDSVQMIL